MRKEGGGLEGGLERVLGGRCMKLMGIKWHCSKSFGFGIEKEYLGGGILNRDIEYYEEIQTHMIQYELSNRLQLRLQHRLQLVN
jgi:hypothetical protein